MSAVAAELVDGGYSLGLQCMHFRAVVQLSQSLIASLFCAYHSCDHLKETVGSIVHTRYFTAASFHPPSKETSQYQRRNTISRKQTPDSSYASKILPKSACSNLIRYYIINSWWNVAMYGFGLQSEGALQIVLI